eukprot:COSAG02_NODE_38002_length_434_cov_2.802985_1_plen_41_part_10
MPPGGSFDSFTREKPGLGDFSIEFSPRPICKVERSLRSHDQ